MIPASLQIHPLMKQKPNVPEPFNCMTFPRFTWKDNTVTSMPQLLIFLLNKVQTILKNTQTLNIAKTIAHAKTEHFWFIWNYP